MNVRQVSLFEVEVPQRQALRFSGGRSTASVKSNVVCLEDDDGVTGWGECCPGGRTYGEAFAEAGLAALRIIAPVLPGLGCDSPIVIGQAMDTVLQGHAYAKAPVIQACYDILGKRAGLPASAFFGGKTASRARFPCFLQAMPVADVLDRMGEKRAEGFQHFIVHVSGDLGGDLALSRAVFEALEDDATMSVDANGGFTRMDALRFLSGLPRDPRLIVEQPCRTYGDCATVKATTGVPMVLDECMTSLETLTRAWADGVIDGLKLKIDRVGGVRAAALMRDAAVTLGLPVWVQASAGTEITQAAITHLALSTPTAMLAGAANVLQFNVKALGVSSCEVMDGFISASDAPGFGVDPDPTVLGEPVLRIEA